MRDLPDTKHIEVKYILIAEVDDVEVFRGEYANIIDLEEELRKPVSAVNTALELEAGDYYE